MEKAAKNILDGRYDSQKVFLVVKKPDVLLELVNKGVPITAINVGNMSQTPETKHVNKSINVTEKDIADFKALADKGVKLTNQMVPGDKQNDFMELLKDL